MIFADKLFSGYLEEGEIIEEIIRRHPIILVESAGPFLFLGILSPAFLWYLFPEFRLLFALWIFVSFVRIFREIMIWYHDTFLVTNVSLIDVYWHGFFDRSSTRLEYPMMEGVTTEMRGLRQVLLNYGTVSVQRGGGTNPLVLNDAMNPQRAERKIMEYHEKFIKARNMQNSESLKNLLSEMVQYHHQQQQAAKNVQ